MTRRDATGGSLRAGRPRSRARLAGLALGLAGAVMVGAFAADLAAGVLQEKSLTDHWASERATRNAEAAGAAAPAPAAPAAAAPSFGPVDGVDFAIRVPRLGYLAAVREGTDSLSLAGGPGRYTELGWPGQPGNVGVAAHNVFWLRFGELGSGDEIVIESRWGDHRYRISGRRIVAASDRSVLVRETSVPQLTLTTCWPLWAGAFADRRLVFTAPEIAIA